MLMPRRPLPCMEVHTHAQPQTVPGMHMDTRGTWGRQKGPQSLRGTRGRVGGLR